MWIKVVNGEGIRYDKRQLRLDNPNVSFPAELSDELLAKYNICDAVDGIDIEHDPATEKLVTQPTATLINGVWTFLKVVEPMTAEEAATRYAVEADHVRAVRDATLAACDWTQVADAPVDQAAWATYRQDLRDITAQAGFPFTIDWPVAP